MTLNLYSDTCEEPAKINFTEPSAAITQFVWEGTKIYQLFCDVTGNPTPSITFEKGNRKKLCNIFLSYIVNMMLITNDQSKSFKLLFYRIWKARQLH